MAGYNLNIDLNQLTNDIGSISGADAPVKQKGGFLGNLIGQVNGVIDKLHSPKVDTEVSVSQKSILLIAAVAIAVVLLAKKR